MKTILFHWITIIFLSLLFFISPLHGQDIRKYKLSGFIGVEIGGAFEVHLKKSPNFFVTAEGEEEDLDNLQFDIDKGVLEVSFKDSYKPWMFKWKRNRRDIVLQIGLPELKEAEFTGAAKLLMSGFTNEEDIKLYFSGASKGIVEDLDAEKFSVELSGASKLKVSGKAVKLNVNASGASSFEALPLISRDADLELSGASRAEVTAKNSMKVDASGAAKVIYKGNPYVSKDLSGAAVVKRIE